MHFSFYTAWRFGTPDKTPVLLTFLKTLPEEVQSSHLKIGENRRRAINAELAQKTHAVIHFLVSIYFDLLRPNEMGISFLKYVVWIFFRSDVVL